MLQEQEFQWRSQGSDGGLGIPNTWSLGIKIRASCMLSTHPAPQEAPVVKLDVVLHCVIKCDLRDPSSLQTYWN